MRLFLCWMQMLDATCTPSCWICFLSVIIRYDCKEIPSSSLYLYSLIWIDVYFTFFFIRFINVTRKIMIDTRRSSICSREIVTRCFPLYLFTFKFVIKEFGLGNVNSFVSSILIKVNEYMILLKRLFHSPYFSYQLYYHI